MKKKLKITFGMFAIAAIISLNMIVTFQSDNQGIYLNSITKAFADSESGDIKTQCIVGTKNAAYDEVRYCGDCKMHRIKPTGDGGC
jgi:hypothetical protein